MSCPGRLVRERLDPVVNNGTTAAHVHNIVGGSAFGPSMTYDLTQLAKCSSCTIKEDKSNYWTPQLYYHAQNGSFLPVPVVGNSDDSNAGMLVYYFQRPGFPNETLIGFPAGFRMLAGDTNKRNFTGGLDAKAVSYNCLGSNMAETNALPNYNCKDGLRVQIFFPSCWDGKNLDSADHRSHMSYFNGTEYNTGVCPSTHPNHTISLFYEVLYDTNRFADMWYNMSSGSNYQPFVFSNGDATGYGFHADFVNGWDVDVLQRATTECTNDSGNVEDCGEVSQYSYDECNACKLPSVVDEKTDGWVDRLPGCNPVSHGPDPATRPIYCPPVAGLGPPVNKYVDLTSSRGWRYAGCASDSVGNRTLPFYYPTSNLTIEKCIDLCTDPSPGGTGFRYAGMEYGRECFCGDQLEAERAPKAGIYGGCRNTCQGNETQTCGGPNALSLYEKCSGSGCWNYEFVQFPRA
ncbi:WSC domain-containing protein [Paraphaeosphaeria minitans]|uniref:WSC domain-containing protein n=1 Tax=Paraphaeosphaeria minitans TaxID=565426 RepID=A0A9P6KSD9_9PLEO|nr:WSC domain-containing protein [Paraphaeosphaeria minitans]